MANEYANIDIVLNLTGEEDVIAKLEKLEEKIKKLETLVGKTANLNAMAKVEAEDKATEKIKKISSKLTSLANKTYSATLDVKDKVSGVISRITSKIKGLSGILTSPLSFIGMGAFAGGFGAIVKESLSIAGEMEQANIAFETMLRNGERARKFLKELEKFSIQTPFELPQLMDASRKLLAYGFSAEKIIPILKDVGNATAGLGLGSEGITRITLALGQMRAKSKITGEE
ncbi:MAG: tape measure protein, partial [Candidatus Aenigmarchaeota archaeon]|nr:tape measure protein [Candidatus Aenigmarchaeota archaeon]